MAKHLGPSMDADALRATRTPLKERYRADPDSAVVTLAANGEGVTCSIKTGRVHAEGDVNLRGTLGVDRDAPVWLLAIGLNLPSDMDADQATLDKLLELTERYCLVAQTLAHGSDISLGIDRAHPAVG